MQNLDSPISDIELCVFVLVDGARPDVIRQMIAAGKLPNMARYFARAGSTLTAVTSLPSTTTIAYLPMLTGQYPGTANVPGIRWVEKLDFGKPSLFHHGHRSYIGRGVNRFNDDLSHEVQTIYELSSSCLGFGSVVQRGLNPSRNHCWPLGALPYTYGHFTHKMDLLDRWMVRALGKALMRNHHQDPRFVFLPLSDVDTCSHGYGPMSGKAEAAYRRVDDRIGEIVEILQKRDLWSKTLVLVSSDHGNTDTAGHLDLSRLVEEAGYRVFEYPLVHRRKCTAAVMVSGNALAHVYVASDGGWEGPLSGERLRLEHGILLEKLKGREGIEWIAYRQEDDHVAVEAANGHGLLGLTDGGYTYHWQGQDPLQLGLQHSMVPRERALAETVDTPFPDALEQLWYLFSSNRTGDIVVTAKPGFDLRARFEWPKHHSSHGALCRDQMLVPLLSNRPLDESGPIRTVDVFATIARSLGLEPAKPHFGRSLI